MQRDQESEKKSAKPRIRPKKNAVARSAALKAQGKPKREPATASGPSLPDVAMSASIPKLPSMQLIPERMQAIQKQYLEDLSRVLVSKPEMEKMAAQDKRFDNPTWMDSFFTGIAALYVLNAKTLTAMTDAVQTDPKTQARLKFLVQQWVDATSPANFFATNPEVHKKMLESQGESLRSGVENLVHDMRKGRISQTDETAFEIGKNVAVTPGEVVYQNKLLQLIQYKPTTEKVGAVPMLFVPPSINKFYIMDLQQNSSLVKFTVDQGNTLFLVSWINEQDEHSQLTWDDYVSDGILKAIDVVLEITGQPKTNVLGFCIGGTIAATGLAHLAARKEDKVNSFTLMTSLLDFSNTGVLDVFIDEQHCRMREQQLAKGGLMKGSELSSTFSFLRPNDLVWNYVVNNYLKGEKPMPFDLLYWNSDSTNLPGPFFAWYLRNMYLENNLVKKNRLTIAGQKMDLSSIRVPIYAMGAREDHIVPWDAAWKSAQALGGGKRFVLGASGHIAGSINPASKNKRSFWVNEDMTASSPQQWLDGATEVTGSWWNDWAKWLSVHRGELVDAPRQCGASRFKPIEPAPGSYVRVRAVSAA
ncbi:MAG: class I poly(R)-hydroxyalkanoic acid synthase [Betaproteobacteria bacterium]|nr:class I poly(R)-hydroxyalkanoic acid synthase [Betaproteobacteria bacterium]